MSTIDSTQSPAAPMLRTIDLRGTSARSKIRTTTLPQLYSTYSVIPRFWGGLAFPETSKDHK
ncbi:hypothetical protein [Rothia sp. LK2492]|uniref:hypothetical protein n=1 Tax=Rothia sp. LK2492 TaxID=3114370 RepID=UPI0034CF5D48